MSRVIVIGAGITGLATAPMRWPGTAIAVTLGRCLWPCGDGFGLDARGRTPVRARPCGIAARPGAVALWARLDEELGAPTGYRPQRQSETGTRCAGGAAHPPRWSRSNPPPGLEISLVEGSDLRALAPALSPEIVCASHCPSDGQAEPLAVAQAYRDAGERWGSGSASARAVTGIDCAGGRFRAARDR